MAYGTPWSGKNDLSSNEGVPVGGIACLRRGQQNEIRPMPAAAAIPYFMSQTVVRLTAEQAAMKLDIMDKMIRQLPIWDLACLPDDEAAYMAHAAMTAPR